MNPRVSRYRRVPGDSYTNEEFHVEFDNGAGSILTRKQAISLIADLQAAVLESDKKAQR